MQFVDDLHSAVSILFEVCYFETASVMPTQLHLLCSYDLSVLTWCCAALSLPLLCLSSRFFFFFWSLLLMWDQSVFCACRLAAFSHVHHPWRRSNPVPKSLRRISPSPLHPSLPLFVSLSSLPIIHFGWVRAAEQQQAYRVVKSLCICLGDCVCNKASDIFKCL